MSTMFEFAVYVVMRSCTFPHLDSMSCKHIPEKYMVVTSAVYLL